jgi:hypothetical protein
MFKRKIQWIHINLEMSSVQNYKGTGTGKKISILVMAIMKT